MLADKIRFCNVENYNFCRHYKKNIPDLAVFSYKTETNYIPPVNPVKGV